MNYGRGVENRRRHQKKRENGKGSRVCGKNEEGIRGSGNSIEKDAGRNEEVYRSK